MKYEFTLEGRYTDTVRRYWNYERNEQEGKFANKASAKAIGRSHWKCDQGHDIHLTALDFIKRVREGKVICVLCKTRENSVGVKYSHLVKEWSEHNDKSPFECNMGSADRVMWRCSKNTNHPEWIAHIGHRTIGNKGKGTGCPQCYAEKKGSLLIESIPKLYEELHYSRNEKENIRNEYLTVGTETKVWWLCRECGHEWRIEVKHRVRFYLERGCPECRKKRVKYNYNSIAILKPEFVKQFWVYSKNLKDGVLDYKITPYAKTKAWFRCDKDHEFKSQTRSVVVAYDKGRVYCPYCSNQKVTPENNLLANHPGVCKEWNDRNKKGPENYLKASGKRVWWKCRRCGHEWKNNICHRTSTRKRGCPRCCESKGEKFIREYLKKKNYFFFREKIFSGKNKLDVQLGYTEVCKNQRVLPYDFCIVLTKKLCKNMLLVQYLLIEYQGRQHYMPIEKFGGEEQLKRQQLHDSIKREYATTNGIPLLEIRYDNKSIENTLDDFISRYV